MLLSAILAWLCIDVGHNWGGDFAMYISQSKALVNGTVNELFETSKYIQDNSHLSLGPYLYPMGYPVLLSPVIQLFGVNFLALKVYGFLFFLACLPLLLSYFKQIGISHFTSLFVVFFVGLNFYYIRFADVILSDFSFMFFSILSLYYFKLSKHNSLIKALILGLLIFFSYFIRDIGIVLLLALAIYQFQYWNENRKTQKWVYFIIPYIVFGVLKLISSYIFPNGAQNHEGILSNTNATIIGENIAYYFNMVGSMLIFPSPMFPPIILILVTSIFTIVVILGMLITLKKHLYLTVYIFASLGIYTIWPVHQGVRFLFPIFPFILMFFGLGLLSILPKLTVKKVFIIMLVMVFAQTLATVNKYLNTDTNVSNTPEMRRIYSYIKTHVNKDETVIFKKPRVLYFYTGRKSFYGTYAHIKKQNKANYILSDVMEQIHLEKYNLVLATEHYKLFKRK